MTYDELKSLSKPIPEEKPRVLFAGEATAPQNWSYLHGARLSGIREAKRVVELMKQWST